MIRGSAFHQIEVVGGVYPGLSWSKSSKRDVKDYDDDHEQQTQKRSLEPKLEGLARWPGGFHDGFDREEHHPVVCLMVVEMEFLMSNFHFSHRTFREIIKGTKRDRA
jgi:hypothetical protein